MKKRILTLNSSYLTLHTKFNSIPLIGCEEEGDSFSFFPGGRGMVSSVAMARFGADCIYCSKVGSDSNANKIESFLKSENIDTRFLYRAQKKKTGLLISLTEQNGRNRVIKFPQAAELLTEGEIEKAFTTYPDALFLQSEVSDELTVFAAKHAEADGVKIFYQPRRKRGSLPPSLLPKLEALILDGDEVYSYCGMEVREFDKCLPACINLASIFKVKYIILRMPERGSFIYDGTYHEIIQTFPSTEIDDSGSSEVFGGVLCADYLKTGNIRQAVFMANIAYALSSSRHGDVKSVPTEAEVAEYIKKFEIKI